MELERLRLRCFKSILAPLRRLSGVLVAPLQRPNLAPTNEAKPRWGMSRWGMLLPLDT